MFYSLNIANSSIQNSLTCSKWQTLNLFLHPNEIRSLLENIDPLFMVRTSQVIKQNEQAIHLDDWVQHYDHLYQSILGLQEEYKDEFKLFNLSLSSDIFCFVQKNFEDSRCLIRLVKPILNLQLLRVFRSEIDETFYEASFGNKAIICGIQISFPSLYQCPITKKSFNAVDFSSSPNSVAFKKLKQWVRAHTKPLNLPCNTSYNQVSLRVGHQINNFELHPIRRIWNTDFKDTRSL